MSPHVSSEIRIAAQEVASRCSHVGDRYIFEFLAAIAGYKKVVRVQVADDSEYAQLEKFADLAGMYITHSPTKMKVAWTNSLGDTFLTSVPWSDPQGVSYAAYIGRKLSEATQAAVVESEGTAEEIGALLGYPKCCCIAYERLEAGEFWAPLLAQSSIDDHYPPWANRYAYLLYGASLFPDYFPCSLGCEGTQQIAKKINLIAIDSGMANLAQSHLDLMRRPIIIGNGFLAGFPVVEDSATSMFSGVVIHEWIQGSAFYLPDLKELQSSFYKRNYSFQMKDKSVARMIFFDQ